jgi:hypothetical protein
MGWATRAIEKLQKGETVSIRPKGNSMRGKIESGNLITIEPLKEGYEFKVDDIVLCKVKGNQYVHLVKGIKQDQYLIGNNRGGINGWIGRNAIFGTVTKVEK